MTLLEKVRSSPPHWANDTIRPFDEELYRDALPFAIRRYWCDSGSVNVFRVVGTRHPDYRNMNWRWMLGNGKRMTENLALHETNPGYYLETVRKVPEMTYLTLDGLDYYVSTDGNHRSTIARFDFHYRGLTTRHGVTIEDVRIDWDLFRAYREIVGLVEEGILACFVKRQVLRHPLPVFEHPPPAHVPVIRMASPDDPEDVDRARIAPVAPFDER